MNNFFGTLYLALSEHLKNSVQELKWIDQDFGQLEEFEYRPEVSFPCCLIDFAQANFTNMAELAQVGELMITLRIGFAPFSQSYQAAPMNVKEKALEYYTIEQKVYEAVQGWHNEFTQPLIRTSAISERREDSLRVRTLTFTTSFEDLSALQTFTKHTANLDIETEINL